jgi:hypothetical protein
MLLTIETVLVLLLWQRPQMPAKLVITSTPAEAPISVDKGPANQTTPATFVVSPGTHSVSIAGQNVKQCGADHPATVTVTPGSTWAVTCDQKGWHWERQTK